MNAGTVGTPAINVARPVLTMPPRTSVLAWLMLLTLLLSVHAAFRGMGSDYDALGYSIWFERVVELDSRAFLDGLAESNLYYPADILFSFEVGFAVLTFLISRISSNIELFFFCVAFLSLTLKSIAISKYCVRPGWAILWYVSWYYLLQEMTTLRAGLATGFLLMGYAHLRDARYVKYSVYIALACLFHASAASAILLVVLRKFEPSVKTVVTLLLLAFATSYINALPLIEVLGGLSDKIAEYYVLYTDVGLYTEVNKFNVIVLLRVVIILAIAIWIPKVESADMNFRFEYSMFAIPVILYYALASFPLVGGRLSELLGVFQIFLVSSVAASWPHLKRVTVIIFMTAVLQFYVLVFHVKWADFFYFYGDSYQIETTHGL